MVNKEFPTDFTTKSNPVDADLLIIADTEDANEMKKITIGSMTADIADGIVVDGSASDTTTYSSNKIVDLNNTQNTTITNNYNTLNTNKLDVDGQLRTWNGAWKTTYNNGSGNETELTLWASGTVLQSNWATSAPSWVAPSADIVWQTEDTSGDMDADFALVYDASATANRKQKVNVYRATSNEVNAWTSTTKFTTPEQLMAQQTKSPNLIELDTSGYMIVTIPTAWAHWTYSGSPTYDINGVTNTANGGATGYCTIMTDFGVQTDLKVKFTNRSWNVPTGTTSSWRWWFIWFLWQNPWITTDGDLANTASRAWFVYYNWNLYALNANNSSITSTLISTYPSEVVDRFQINYTTTSITFYRNWVLVATHTTNIPSSQSRFWSSGVNGGGGAGGNVFGNIIFAQKRT